MLTKGTVDDNHTYLFPVDEEIEENDFREFIQYHRANEGHLYKKKLREYKNDTPIMHQKFSRTSNKHNRISVPFPKYLVDTLNGFFVGIPPVIKTEDEIANNNLQAWIKQNSMLDKISEISKQSSIYGRTYVLIYNNELRETRMAICAPTTSFMIFDDTLEQKPLAFVRYGIDNNGRVSGDVYYNAAHYTFDNLDIINMTKREDTVFAGLVPAVEFYDNEERQGVFDNVSTMIHAFNKVLSSEADDSDYFADAYLFLKNFSIPADKQPNIVKSRIIQTKQATKDLQDVDAKFLERPTANTTQENMLNRMNNLIFQTSMVANINDEVFGNATSGTALEYKLLSMRNLTSNKERKFTQSMTWLFDVLRTNIDIGEPSDIQYAFTRNLPDNVSEEATLLEGLNGVISDETRFSLASFISSPQEEMERIKKEQEEKQKVQQSYLNVADYLKSDDKNNNSETTTEKDLNNETEDETKEEE